MAPRRIWDAFLTERDKHVFEAAGSGQRAGFGKRPALLVVDVNYNFTGDRPEPILASIQRWPNSCGEDAWEALHHIKRLLQAARRKGIPVLYSTGGGRADGWDRGSWAWKNKRTSVGHPRHSLTPSRVDGNTINHEIAPLPQDIVIKQ
jgi:maleamate amidohydrolase